MLAEVEIFDCLVTNLRAATEDCQVLAWHPRRGRVYMRFLESLKLIEGACRQAYYWRDYDARWLLLGNKMAEVHRRAGTWLRASVSKDDRRKANPLFARLADKLREALAIAQRVRFRATFRLGPIAPILLPGPHRETRPVQILTPGGIWLPEGVTDARIAA